MKRLKGLSPNFYREFPDNFNAALQNQHCVNRRNLTVSVYIAEDFLLVGKLDSSNRCFKGSKGVGGGYLAVFIPIAVFSEGGDDISVRKLFFAIGTPDVSRISRFGQRRLFLISRFAIGVIA